MGVAPPVSRPLEGVVVVWNTPRWREREMLPSYRLRKKAVDDENERQVRMNVWMDVRMYVHECMSV